MALSTVVASAANFPSIKGVKYVATLAIAIAGLTTHAEATPITYSYIGADFTFGTGPAGFTTSDNITASFTVNNLLAPSMTFNLASIGATLATISNGVHTLALIGGTVTTDASGNIVGWDFNEQETLSDLSIVRLESFRDGAFGGDAAHKFLLDETSRDAFNSVSGTWSSGPATVPDQGATLTLICLSLVMLLGFKYAQHKSVTAICSFAVRTCLLGVILALTPLGQGAPVTTRFTGTVFDVPVVNPFGSSLGDEYVMLINYDPALLAGVPVGDFTHYESAAGETLITFSWISAGDTFTSDKSFPVTISINNGPPADQFSLSGHIDPMTTLNLNLFASFGEDPLSSENLPTTSADWGDGVGSQWTVAEIFIDRGFDRLSSGISTLEVVNSVPDSGSSLFLLGASALVLAGLCQRKTKAVHSA